MSKYQDLTRNIPWKSFGRKTAVSKVGQSLVPVGVLPFTPQPVPADGIPVPVIPANSPDAEKFLMNIVGTAIQAGCGKLVTCLHVAEGILDQKRDGYILSRVFKNGTLVYVPYPVQEAFRFVDPRTDKVNPDVDLAVLLCLPKSTDDLPYDAPNICWGDSTQLGVGDEVVIGGYPHGEKMFFLTKSNRGIVQPTFYSGIISAIFPATESNETRILQISIPSAGGMSGGAVFDPITGAVMGMITSCLQIKGIPQPMSYAIPSEIIYPYVEVITFSVGE